MDKGVRPPVSDGALFRTKEHGRTKERTIESEVDK